MLLKIEQGQRRGVMKRKFMQGSDILTDEDHEQVQRFAEKYRYKTGPVKITLIEHEKRPDRLLPYRVVRDVRYYDVAVKTDNDNLDFLKSHIIVGTIPKSDNE